MLIMFVEPSALQNDQRIETLTTDDKIGNTRSSAIHNNSHGLLTIIKAGS
jgi:hypothetical protein